MNEEEKEQRRHEKHVRWQEIRVTQFGYVNYLILTFAVGALVFIGSLLTDNQNGNSLRSWYFVPLLAFSVSVVFGICCAVTRLLDFRGTAKVAKFYHDKQRGYSNSSKGLETASKAESCHRCTEKFGDWSWGLLWCQIIFFGVGGIASLIVLFLHTCSLYSNYT